MLEKNEYVLCSRCQDSFKVNMCKTVEGRGGIYCPDCVELIEEEETMAICPKCNEPIDFNIKCYQLRTGHFEKHDGDFHTYEHIAYYHKGCI